MNKIFFILYTSLTLFLSSPLGAEGNNNNAHNRTPDEGEANNAEDDTHLDQFPEEIWLMIALQLPVQDLENFALVNRAFRRIAHSKECTKMIAQKILNEANESNEFPYFQYFKAYQQGALDKDGMKSTFKAHASLQSKAGYVPSTLNLPSNPHDPSILYQQIAQRIGDKNYQLLWQLFEFIALSNLEWRDFLQLSPPNHPHFLQKAAEEGSLLPFILFALNDCPIESSFPGEQGLVGALYFSVLSGHEWLSKLLLYAGSDKTLWHPYYRNKVCFDGVEKLNLSTLKLLLKSSDFSEKSHFSKFSLLQHNLLIRRPNQTESLEVFRWLVEQSEVQQVINHQGPLDETCLHWVVSNIQPQMELVSLLLDHNANPHILNQQGLTALDIVNQRLEARQATAGPLSRLSIFVAHASKNKETHETLSKIKILLIDASKKPRSSLS